MRRPTAAGIAGFALAFLARPGAALACAVCGCGDPTLTVMGDEKPFGGRLRLDLETRLGMVRVGTPGVDEIVLREERMEAALAYAPTPSIFLVLDLPVLHQYDFFHDGTTSNAWSPGDVELRVKGFVWRARRGVFSHQVAIQPRTPS